MNMEYHSNRPRRRFKKAVCIIVFFFLGVVAGYCLPGRTRIEAREEPSRIKILNFQKIQRLNELKIEVSRIPGDRAAYYRVNILANIELAETEMGPLFNQFQIVEGGDQ